MASPFVDQIRALVRREITFADEDPADAQAFALMSRERSHRVAFQLCLTVIAVTLAAWPLDPLLFHSGAVQREVSPVWRLTMLALTVPLALFHHRTPRVLRGNPAWVGFLMMVAAAIPAWGLSRSGGIEQPAFGALYLVTFATVPLVVPIGVRAILTVAVPTAMLTSFFACNPAHLHHPLVGTVFSVMVTVVLCSIAVGQVYYTLTRRLFAQNRALDQRARDFQELDRVRRDLFANLSHEFRTPLTLIRGAFHQLDRVSADPAVRSAIAPGLRNADQLLHLVEDLLELARFDAGRREPDRRAMDLARLVREVAGNFPLRLGSELHLHGCDGSVLLNADPRQLRMVLNNLLGNAQKFTRPDDRRVEVTLTDDPQSVRLTVRDNGEGVDPAILPTIFDRFVQGTGGPARRHEGTGIGLSVVREVIVHHGGSVDVASELGQGSVFTLTLPRVAGTFPREDVAELAARASSQPPLALAATGAVGEATILVVDDNAELRGYLRSLLAPRYRVLAASDGEAALRSFDSAAPDLVITDLMMPGMDGMTFFRALRGDPARPRVPVLMLTAKAGDEARHEALEAGAEEFLTKPFDERELLARVRNLLTSHGRTQALVTDNALLTERLLGSEEAERGRIARDLHDELGQHLTAARLEAELAAGTGSMAAMHAVIRRLDDSLTAMRAVVLSLRPRALDELGLSAALGGLLDAFGRELECDWDVSVDDERVDPATALTAFRAVQECLTNVRRHARARVVTVRVALVDDRLALSVADDGVGFDPAQAWGATRSGLAGLRERVTMSRGEVRVESAPGRGTLVAIEIPVAPTEQRRIA